MDRLLRARVIVAEARALGLSVNDLVTAAAGAPASREDVPTVSDYLRRIEPTFSKGTQRTYRSYWRLAERHFGDRRIRRDHGGRLRGGRPGRRGAGQEEEAGQ